MDLTLVILAAGLGSRYGGLKQLDAFGPAGETILDYAIFDAVQAGFSRVVFVIRHDFEALFRRQIGEKYADKVRVSYAFQSLDALPRGFTALTGRTKPWGTGHAVWCAREVVDGPFAVINADDFYGRDSFEQLVAFFRSATAASSVVRPQFASVGFRLANTLSENGAVSRGICRVREDGFLDSVAEQTGIRPEQVGVGLPFSGSEIVSMNCWGFMPALFPVLSRGFEDFLEEHATDVQAEFYLPAAISALIAGKEADVRVLSTQASWLGVTYQEDKPRVTATLADLARIGEYPMELAQAFEQRCSR